MNPLMVFFNSFLPYFDAIVMMAIVVGAVVAYKQGFTKTSVETQEKAIVAQQALIATLSTRIEALEKEVGRLQGLIETTQDLLAQKGIYITISGDMVTIEGANGKPSGIRRRPRPVPGKEL